MPNLSRGALQAEPEVHISTSSVQTVPFTLRATTIWKTVHQPRVTLTSVSQIDMVCRKYCIKLNFFFFCPFLKRIFVICTYRIKITHEEMDVA